MEQQDVQKMIDTSIAKATAFATKKYGDTPTDALQLVPKKYVSSIASSILSVVSSVIAAIPSSPFAGTEYNASVTTTNSSIATLFTYTLSTGVLPTTTWFVDAKVIGVRTNGSGVTLGDSGGFIRRATIYSPLSGYAVLGAVQDGFTQKSDSNYDCTVSIVSGGGTITNAIVAVTGDTGNNINWRGQITVSSVQ